MSSGGIRSGRGERASSIAFIWVLGCALIGAPILAQETTAHAPFSESAPTFDGFIAEDPVGRLGLEYLTPPEPIAEPADPALRTRASADSGGGGFDLPFDVDLEPSTSVSPWRERIKRRWHFVLVALAGALLFGYSIGRSAFSKLKRWRQLTGPIVKGVAKKRDHATDPDGAPVVALWIEDTFVGELIGDLATDHGLLPKAISSPKSLGRSSLVCAFVAGWESGVDSVLPDRRRGGRLSHTVGLLLNEATRSQVWTAVARGAVACRVGAVDLDHAQDVLRRLHGVALHDGPGGLPAWVMSAIAGDLARSGDPPISEMGRLFQWLGASVKGRAGSSVVVYVKRGGFVLLERNRRGFRKEAIPEASRHLPAIHLSSSVQSPKSIHAVRMVPAAPFLLAWVQMISGELDGANKAEELERLLRELQLAQIPR
ncbi:MAG: hypothetical protein CME06_15465 [Gemmatimonadetes bacterium]|nr:hypothetical protein [Gemmatimonadota bacterium]